MEQTPQKQIAYERERIVVEKIADGLGYGIEKGIEDTVIYLRLLGFTTSMSCAGHSGNLEDLQLPYVEISVSSKPEEKYVGEAEFKESLVKKYKLELWRDIFDGGKIEEEYNLWLESIGYEKTLEYKTWEEKIPAEFSKIEDVLMEYTSIGDSPKIVFKDGRILPDLLSGDDLLTSLGKEMALRNLQELVKEAQLEFQKFTEFLKQKYYAE
jgi:hypothetical protein